MEKVISAGHARCLLALNSAEEQIAALHTIIKRDLNVRDTENLIKKSKKDPGEKKQAVTKDRFINDLEKSLSSKLMAKVQINGSDKKGLIEIKYTSMDELNRLSGYILDELQ